MLTTHHQSFSSRSLATDEVSDFRSLYCVGFYTNLGIKVVALLAAQAMKIKFLIWLRGLLPILVLFRFVFTLIPYMAGSQLPKGTQNVKT